MIARLTGTLLAVLADRVHLEAVGGFVFEVLVPAGDVPAFDGRIGGRVTFHTLFYLEGDAGGGGGAGGNLQPRLVGFDSDADRRFFGLFVTVKGIGPRKALRALALPASEVARAIENRDVRTLATLPGIGKRGAETIVAELAGKAGPYVSGVENGTVRISPRAASPVGSLSAVEADAVDALVALGEKRTDAETLLARARTRGEMPDDANALLGVLLALR